MPVRYIKPDIPGYPYPKQVEYMDSYVTFWVHVHPGILCAFAGLDTSADTWFRSKRHAVRRLPNRGDQLEHCVILIMLIETQDIN